MARAHTLRVILNDGNFTAIVVGVELSTDVRSSYVGHYFFKNLLGSDVAVET
jgi:hypothetical protein